MVSAFPIQIDSIVFFPAIRWGSIVFKEPSVRIILIFLIYDARGSDIIYDYLLIITELKLLRPRLLEV